MNNINTPFRYLSTSYLQPSITSKTSNRLETHSSLSKSLVWELLHLYIYPSSYPTGYWTPPVPCLTICTHILHIHIQFIRCYNSSIYHNVPTHSNGLSQSYNERSYEHVKFPQLVIFHRSWWKTIMSVIALGIVFVIALSSITYIRYIT